MIASRPRDRDELAPQATSAAVGGGRDDDGRAYIDCNRLQPYDDQWNAIKIIREDRVSKYLLVNDIVFIVKTEF